MRKVVLLIFIAIISTCNCSTTKATVTAETPTTTESWLVIDDDETHYGASPFNLTDEVKSTDIGATNMVYTTNQDETTAMDGDFEATNAKPTGMMFTAHEDEKATATHIYSTMTTTSQTPLDYQEKLARLTVRQEVASLNLAAVDVLLDSIEMAVTESSENVTIPRSVDPEEHSISVEDALDRASDFVSEQLEEIHDLLSNIEDFMFDMESNSGVIYITFTFRLKVLSFKARVEKLYDNFTDAKDDISDLYASQKQSDADFDSFDDYGSDSTEGQDLSDAMDITMDDYSLYPYPSDPIDDISNPYTSHKQSDAKFDRFVHNESDVLQWTTEATTETTVIETIPTPYTRIMWNWPFDDNESEDERNTENSITENEFLDESSDNDSHDDDYSFYTPNVPGIVGVFVLGVVLLLAVFLSVRRYQYRRRYLLLRGAHINPNKRTSRVQSAPDHPCRVSVLNIASVATARRPEPRNDHLPSYVEVVSPGVIVPPPHYSACVNNISKVNLATVDDLPPPDYASTLPRDLPTVTTTDDNKAIVHFEEV